MIDPVLKSCLEALLRRERQRRFWLRMAQAWGAAALAGCGLLGLRGWVGGPAPEPWTAAALVIAMILLAARVGWRRREPDLRRLAREIEQQHPDLEGRLLTAVQQEPDARGDLGFLQDRLVHEVLRHASHAGWSRAPRWGGLLFGHGLHAVALAAFVGVIGALQVSPGRAALAVVLPPSAMVVTPGDTELERGDSLVVLARFGGPAPVQAELVLRPVNGVEQRVTLVRGLEDQVFGATVPNVTESLVYRVEVEGRRTQDYAVRVFEYPRMEKADAELVYPAYTGRDARRVEDVRRLSAVAGTRLDLSVQLNKPVARARLAGRETGALDLQVVDGQPLVLLSGHTLGATDTYRLELVDEAGRTNRVPAQFVFEVLENRRPELKLTRPRGDQRPSPLEEVVFEGTVWDDFGVLGYGLGWSKAGGEPQVVELGGKVAGEEKRAFKHLLALEGIGVAPEDLVLWYVWADDFGPDGHVRRTTGDLLFGEVRPFDEIFREGQSGGDSASSAAQQGEESGQSPAGQLVELQREIVNATWNLRRVHSVVSPDYAEAAKIVRDSQVEALSRAEEASAAVSQPALAALWSAVCDRMDEAADRLEAAPGSVAALTPALAAEQAAYQALLRLQEREYSVAASRNQRGRQPSGRQQAMQRQLDQLELRESEDRYETQSEASAPVSEERRETLQMLNRLRELAQRQQDVNQRLQELQTAQLQAQTEEEREQIRRELKRLREEQQRMLADLDALQQRMNQPQNQSRMAEQREQLENTREAMRRSAEATQQESLSQALASGTRAQRQMETLRDELRRESASAFAEDLRRMRTEARDLVQRQDSIQKELDALVHQERKALSDEPEKEALVNRLAEQKEDLDELVREVTRVSAEAETAEPLASRELYDALRAFTQDDAAYLQRLQEELVDRGMLTRRLYERLRAAAREPGAKSVEATAEMIRQNYLTVADQAEEQTRAGVNRLARGVERAAERVIGDDTEALRRARQQLDDAARALEREMAEAEGRESDAQPGQPASPAGDRSTDEPASGAGESAARTAASERPEGERGQPSAQPSSQEGQPGGGPQSVDLDRLLGGGETRQGPGGRWGGPLTGSDFLAWSDQLREVEELVDWSEWRNEVAAARERARLLRQGLRDASQRPDWAVVRGEIIGPLVEVRDRVSEELARRDADRGLVPIDRDPVPGRFVELVREYYEDLGGGR